MTKKWRQVGLNPGTLCCKPTLLPLHQRGLLASAVKMCLYIKDKLFQVSGFRCLKEPWFLVSCYMFRVIESTFKNGKYPVINPIGLSYMFHVSNSFAEKSWQKLESGRFEPKDLLPFVCTLTPTLEGVSVERWKNAIRYMTKNKKEKSKLPGN